MGTKRLKLPWGIGADCPCGSTEPFTKCCRGIDGAPRAKPFDLEADLPHTGYDHPKCYLAGSGKCTDKISHEHPVSHNILRKLDNFSLRGFPGAAPDVDVVIPAKKLAYPVLCTAHNGGISDLDSFIGRFFEQYREQAVDIWRPSEEPLRFWQYVNGPMLEAWAVKVGVGLTAGRKYKGDDGSQIKVDLQKVRNAVLSGKFEPGGGMYICGSFSQADIKAVAVKLIQCGGWLVGVWIVIAGFGFATIFDYERFWLGSIPHNATYRGSIHQMFGQGGDVFIFLSWPHKAEVRRWSRGKLEFAPYIERNLDIRVKGGLKPTSDFTKKSFIDKPPPFEARLPDFVGSMEVTDRKRRSKGY